MLLVAVALLMLFAISERSLISSSPTHTGVFIALGVVAAIAYMRLRRGIRRTERAIL